VQRPAPGALKNALDWPSRVQPQAFAGKRVAIQTGSPGAIGGARAQYHLRQILAFLDTYTINKPEVMIGQIAAKIDTAIAEITDKPTEEFVAQKIAALAVAARW
jgi:chromate reductase